MVHAAEIARFEAKIVEGPGEYCTIWRGAIGDDGYGRFSITREGREGLVNLFGLAGLPQFVGRFGLDR